VSRPNEEFLHTFFLLGTDTSKQMANIPKGVDAVSAGLFPLQGRLGNYYNAAVSTSEVLHFLNSATQVIRVTAVDAGVLILGVEGVATTAFADYVPAGQTRDYSTEGRQVHLAMKTISGTATVFVTEI
jgi:hypothetical protein